MARRDHRRKARDGTPEGLFVKGKRVRKKMGRRILESYTVVALEPRHAAGYNFIAKKEASVGLEPGATEKGWEGG